MSTIASIAGIQPDRKVQYFQLYLQFLMDALQTMEVTDRKGRALTVTEGIEKWCMWTEMLHQEGGMLFFIGNGASAMMASHMAADAIKNAGIKSIAFNDAALLTAVSNDLSYQDSFSLPLRRVASQRDILVSISSSGSSPNIIAALNEARGMGLRLITFSGMSSKNPSRKLGDLNFYVPSPTYGIVESAHQLILHCWLDRYME